MLRIALLALFVGLAVAGAAQPDTTRNTFWHRFQYKASGDGTLSTGNVERLVLQTTGVLQYADSLLDWSLVPHFKYGELTQPATEQLRRQRTVQEREYDVNAHIGVFSARKFYGFAVGAAEQSRLRAVEFRWLVGLGGGWHLVKRATQKLTFTAAVLYEDTDFMPTAVADYRVLRGSVRLKGKHSFATDHVRVAYTANWLPGLQFDGNTRYNAQLGLDVPLNRYVTIRGGFEYSYETVVAPGRQRQDTRTFIGFSVGNF